MYELLHVSFPEQFQLGDGMKYGEYINYGLKREVKYVVGVVAVSENSTNPTITMTSSDFSEYFSMTSYSFKMMSSLLQLYQ